MAAGILDWTAEDVATWLTQQGFSQYVTLLCKTHAMDGKGLLLLTEHDLKSPPVGMTILGDIKRLCICLRMLRKENSVVFRSLGDTSDHSFLDHSDTSCTRSLDCWMALNDGCHHTAESRQKVHIQSNGQISSHLEPEYIKLLMSYLYMFCVFMLTSFVMVIVHDRVPDMKKYPPLPDLVLDNLPFIPGAFEMCELTGLILSVICFVVLVFHKHRFIILRRLFALGGTVFLLRCVTMLITSLSVPGTHLQCQPKAYGNFWSKLERTLVIWKGCGMSLQGVRTCGDYMFSGHTVVLTLLNFFITEYTPRKMYLLHTATWVMNIFGIFFILAAHEHYSIDVFIAFYLTSRLFLYYHTLANNRTLNQPDSNRTRIWFPMFSFFEAKIDGIVCNEYEWPFKISKILTLLKRKQS